MSCAQLYDAIGATYAVTRRTEPRIAARVWAALGDARTVLNVGAGTGSYEPPDRNATGFRHSGVGARFWVLVTVSSSWLRACPQPACRAG